MIYLFSKVDLTWMKSFEYSFEQTKTDFLFSITFVWCCPGLNWQPSACTVDVISGTPWRHLLSLLVYRSSLFWRLSWLEWNHLNIILIKWRTVCFQKFAWCCPGLNWRSSACKADLIIATPQHLEVADLKEKFVFKGWVD